MKELTLNRVGHWTRGAGVVALLALAWALFIPGGGLIWSVVLAAGVVGTAIAIAVLTHSRSIPLAGAGHRERGGRAQRRAS